MQSEKNALELERRPSDLLYSQIEMLDCIRQATIKSIGGTAPLPLIREKFLDLYHIKLPWVNLSQEMHAFERDHLITWRREGPLDKGDVGLTREGLKALNSDCQVSEP